MNDSGFFVSVIRLWTRLLAWAISAHIGKLRSDAQQAGERDGYRRGHETGYDSGFIAGQRIYRFEDKRSPPTAKPIDPGLYGPDLLAVTDSKREAMRREVAAAVKAKVVKPPTDEQWRMILADHPATCISAGAGSGKSTTLVLRVVFMLTQLNVPEHELTVISFTRASCAELRQTLGRVLEHWRGAPVPEEATKRMVRTFHSVLLGLCRQPLPDAKFFELIKKNEVDENASADDEDVENPMSSSNLNERQVEYLANTYRGLYASSPPFREHVRQLLMLECVRATSGRVDESFQTKSDGLFHYFSTRDHALTVKNSDLWRSHGWPFPGITDEPVVLFSKNNKHVFYANGYVTATGLPIVLGFPPQLSQQKKQELIEVPPAKATTFANALSDKMRTVGTFCDKRYAMIRSQEDVELLRLRQAYVDTSEPTSNRHDAPMFKIRLKGELRPVMIYEAMFTQGSFIESMGKDVVELLKALPAFTHEGIEHHFCAALGHYWIELGKFLADKGIVTFNRAFQALTQNAQTMGFDPSRLAMLRHLLVDEFQDISPQIAFWLTAMQRRLILSDPDKPLSVMAIGDDWQSIYGWRGSSPQLFIEFGSYFLSHKALGPSTPIKLTANFRSVAPIVGDAARLLKYVSSKVEKPCKPMVSTQVGDHGVQLSTYTGRDQELSEEEVVNELCKFIEQQYQAAKAMTGAKAEHVIVMARRRPLRNALEAKLGKQPGLNICTYHQAKGLEADIAILAEDCIPGPSHPLRNLFYKSSGVFRKEHTYDQAALDEVFRLAYVGVSRGRRRVFWKIPSLKRAAAAKCYGSEAVK
ncbi:superfamily I DNA/RNA helicase [Rhodanobacter sp. ANJX3]|uniref:UvrD-helicase domain-containing protein n=1 Tax=Rhodanobacter sp. ANJX3 TaxID=2723083 RepID=UPI0016194AB9|nr:UvrD-helicase domain-containing protein [Rhodanobacter sp. ANJX3]MBB5356830.1 superfamily I DNA/RNA helicase [Rhodanobacter sp. ANJX3]